jgi:hypothetical protein
MKKLAIWALVVVFVVALTGCDLIFFTTVEYNISGSSVPLNIRYHDESGEIIDVTISSPWSTAFNLGTSKRPFLAFIQVDNNGLVDVTVYIREDGSTKATGIANAGGAVLDLVEIID